MFSRAIDDGLFDVLSTPESVHPHVHDEDLDFYVRGQLEPGPLSAVEPHLSVCNTCKNRLARKIELDGHLSLKFDRMPTWVSDKRTEPRFKTGNHATMQEIHPLNIERLQAEIVDVSKNGIGVVAPKSVLPSTIVQIRIGTTIFLAEARNCVSADRGYRIGLRLLREYS